MEVSATTAKESRDQFLQLLVTQLQHQDPLEPMKQEDFLSQLAQFSTLEGIENLNTTINDQVTLQKDALFYQQVSQSASLVGREVNYEISDANGQLENSSGTIDSVTVSNGGVSFKIGQDSVTLAQITGVAGEPSLTTAQQLAAAGAAGTSSS